MCFWCLQPIGAFSASGAYGAFFMCIFHVLLRMRAVGRAILTCPHAQEQQAGKLVLKLLLVVRSSRRNHAYLRYGFAYCSLALVCDKEQQAKPRLSKIWLRVLLLIFSICDKEQQTKARLSKIGFRLLLLIFGIFGQMHGEPVASLVKILVVKWHLGDPVASFQVLQLLHLWYLWYVVLHSCEKRKYRCCCNYCTFGIFGM